MFCTAECLARHSSSGCPDQNRTDMVFYALACSYGLAHPRIVAQVGLPINPYLLFGLEARDELSRGNRYILTKNQLLLVCHHLL